jgi:hypothetical protein
MTAATTSATTISSWRVRIMCTSRRRTGSSAETSSSTPTRKTVVSAGIRSSRIAFCGREIAAVERQRRPALAAAPSPRPSIPPAAAR